MRTVPTFLFDLYLRLDEAHGVDSRQHDAVDGVGGDDLLRHVVGMFEAEGVELGVLDALHLIIEETVEVPVVLVDVKRVGARLSPHE